MTMTFENALARFVTATKTSMTYARKCSEMAIAHYQEHGDLSQCQKFLDAMPKNFTRRQAFLKWLADHAPVAMEAGKLIKDRSANAVEFNIEGALAKPFWDYEPEKEIMEFTVETLAKAIVGVIARHENGEKMKPANKAAQAELIALKRAVEPVIAKAA